MKNQYGICYNPEVAGYLGIIEKLKNLLNLFNAKYSIFSVEELSSECDFVFVIGGDGTILKTARFYSKLEVPIFGINIGHLGFLSQASDCELEKAIEKIMNNEYKIENRTMLECGNYTALNDFVIKGTESSRATIFSLEIDGKFVCEYFADGLIVSTPTGSTAYGMASGGPVLSPEADVIEIVPICPHTFSARPIVVPSEAKIKIKGQNYCISADGQEIFTSDKDIFINKSKYNAKLVLLSNNDFYSVLRNKLHWGITPVKGDK